MRERIESSAALGAAVCWAAAAAVTNSNAAMRNLSFMVRAALAEPHPCASRTRSRSPTADWLFLHPNFVADDVALVVFDRRVFGYRDLAGNGLDGAQKGLAYLRFCAARHRCGGNLVHEAILSVGCNDNYSSWMRIALCRFIFEIDPDRGQEDEGEDQRDHDVVVNAAPVIGPENVISQRAANRAGGKAGRGGRRGGTCFDPFQVYVRLLTDALQSTLSIPLLVLI